MKAVKFSRNQTKSNLIQKFSKIDTKLCLKSSIKLSSGKKEEHTSKNIFILRPRGDLSSF